MSTPANNQNDPLLEQMERSRRNRYILGALGIAGVIAAVIVILYGFVVAAPGF